jgi:hypothetical protein
MTSTSDLNKKAKTALRSKCTGTDERGYFREPQENLVPGVNLEQFEDDLRKGDGNELRMKFCAAHSSAALAVNCFAPFKHSQHNLSLLGQTGGQVTFEKKLQIFPGRRGPNIDVWIERENDVVAVESKLLEYLTPKKAKFDEIYAQLGPKTEPAWWKMYQQAKNSPEQHLDRAQLIKHYFGLRDYQNSAQRPLQVTLLYIFWEPLNWQEVEQCKRHRSEIAEFAAAVSTSTILFRWMTYNELWKEWSTVPALAEHANRLITRYEVAL